MFRLITINTVLLASLLFAGCSTVSNVDKPMEGWPAATPDSGTIVDTTLRNESRSRYGNPPAYVVDGKLYYVLQSAHGYVARGIASWYGAEFHGRRTSSGEPYNMYVMTAAHRTLPIPCYARVTNVENGKSAVVRVNDRGPFRKNRLIDLSYVAAVQLGIVRNGTGMVEVRTINPPPGSARAPLANEQPSPTTPSRLYVQVGAFANRANAEHLRNRLLGTTKPEIRIQEARIGRNPVYRVRMGPFRTVQEAHTRARALARHGIDAPQLVVE
jgi:rare lipoprotein A